MILATVSTFIISMPDIFLITSYAQPVVKEILIGPDTPKDWDDTYKPDNITINKGDKIMWLNKDFGIHTITENQGLFSSEDLRPDETFEHTFETVGTYDYHCKLHTEMVGIIVVN